MTALPMSDVAVAVVLGAMLGVGACFIGATIPQVGAPSLTRRIAPYIRDVTDPRGVSAIPAPPLFEPRTWWPAVQRRVGTVAGASESVARRLAQAGVLGDVGGFRGRQLSWGIGGLAVGAAVAVALAVAGRASVAAVLLPLVGAVVGGVACDIRLTRRARSRVARLEEELPAVLEFLALCLSAGEGIFDAIRRVGDVGAGELTGELRSVVIAVRTGGSLPDALAALASRLRMPVLTRSVDHLVAAIERGAPLAQVLQDQASDAREDAKRGLIESAGRKEIYMLVPLVFMILPLSVLFAVFPGVHMLRLGIG